MNIFFQIYQLTKKNIYFFIPIQIFICIVNLYLAYSMQDILYILYVPIWKSRSLLELMILTLNFISTLISLYIFMGIEFGPFSNYIFTRTRKFRFLINKNIVLFCYSIIIGFFFYLEYLLMIKFSFNIILNIKLLIIYILLMYIIYLLAYITTLILKSNQISLTILILTYIYIIYSNINIMEYFKYMIENIPILIIFTLILNMIYFIALNKYNKPLKRGSD